jgi:hypothetical protein
MSAEREGARDAIGRMSRQLQDSGMKPDQAQQKAREAALRYERTNPPKK